MLGKLITLEGPDASGKSSQAPILAQHLKDRGYDVITMREPGGCAAAEIMRDLILKHNLDVSTEILLFAAGRTENLAKIIRPALEAGQIVIADRFHDSSFAYQGFGRQKMHDVMELEAFALRGFEPHYTLFFDVPFEECERRLEERRQEALRLSGEADNRDRFEKEDRRFKERVYKGYQQRFRNNPHRMHRIDALPSKDEVTAQIKAWANIHFDDLS